MYRRCCAAFTLLTVCFLLQLLVAGCGKSQPGSQASPEMAALKQENSRLQEALAAATQERDKLQAQTQSQGSQIADLQNQIKQVQEPGPVRQRPAAKGSAGSSAGSPLCFVDIGNSPARSYIDTLGRLGVFGATGGKFNPAGTVTRGEFVTWLVQADNRIMEYYGYKGMPEAEAGYPPSFTDLPASHPDFPSIQGFLMRGIDIGFGAKQFRPNDRITRQEMIAIKALAELGPARQSPGESQMTFYADAKQIDRRYWGVIYQDSRDRFSNLARAYGGAREFHPATPATRAEAAAVLAQFGDFTAQLAAERKAQGYTVGTLRQGGPRGEGFSGGGPPPGGGPPGGGPPAGGR